MHLAICLIAMRRKCLCTKDQLFFCSCDSKFPYNNSVDLHHCTAAFHHRIVDLHHCSVDLHHRTVDLHHDCIIALSQRVCSGPNGTPYLSTHSLVCVCVFGLFTLVTG